MLRLGGVEFGLGRAPELLSAFVAYQAAGFFAWLKRRPFLFFVGLVRFDLVERLVLVFFQPFKRALDFC